MDNPDIENLDNLISDDSVKSRLRAVFPEASSHRLIFRPNYGITEQADNSNGFLGTLELRDSSRYGYNARLGQLQLEKRDGNALDWVAQSKSEGMGYAKFLAGVSLNMDIPANITNITALADNEAMTHIYGKYFGMTPTHEVVGKSIFSSDIPSTRQFFNTFGMDIQDQKYDIKNGFWYG
jgi:hypothetical protein